MASPSGRVATRPQASWPSWPAAIGYRNHGFPSHGGMLDAQTPQPSILIRIWLGAGSGTGTCCSSTTRGCVITAAVIVCVIGRRLVAGRGLAAHALAADARWRGDATDGPAE